LEPECLGEPDHRRARGIGAPGELLCRVEGGLVEVVHDVLADVLLGARELLEAGADLVRKGQRGSAVAAHGPWDSPTASRFFPLWPGADPLARLGSRQHSVWRPVCTQWS